MARRIEKGTYRGRAIAGSEQYGTTSKGNDQIVLELDLLDIGERVSTFLVFSDNSAEFSVDRLRACGWEGEDLSNLQGIDRNEVSVSVWYEEYQGKEQMKVEIATGGGRVVLDAPMDDKAKRAFGARFRHLTKPTAANPGARSQGGDTSFPHGANAPRQPQSAGGGRAKF